MKLPARRLFLIGFVALLAALITIPSLVFRSRADEPPPALLGDLQAQSGRPYEVATLAPDALVYTDRRFVFTELPPAYVGQAFIRSANADKSARAAEFLRFTLAQPAMVYVAYDARATVLPAWLADWAPTGETIGTSDVGRVIYGRAFPAGPVALGGNLASPAQGVRSTYSVIVVPIAPEPTPEPTLEPTHTPTAEPTAEPTPEPTLTPTAEPTAEPTLTPTAELTAEPTLTPTSTPDIATEPTAEPTLEPTAEPTAEPSPEPTLDPTLTPTASPTAEPTVTPTVTPTASAPASPLDRQGAQWATVEWSFENPGVGGNPYDLLATAEFVHVASGETIRSELFYAGGQTWKLRFTGTRPGDWRFSTASADPELSGHAGTVSVAPSGLPGFVGHVGSTWVRTGTGEAFVPQLVMAPSLQQLAADPALADRLIDQFIREHGFNGFHIPVYCRWFDISQEGCATLPSSPSPDQRSFAALEQLITKTYEAGGVVHIWVWGDNQRGQTPRRWGINGPVDQRLQRYIAARLGPLPGWSMGYGFDLWEWVSGEQLDVWHGYMQSRMGWRHLLGARSRTNELTQLSEKMDYASYEQHKPGYQTYRAIIAARTTKPAFAEDRFRIRDGGREKDYSPDETRRGLWHSTLAGGVANIWGNLSGGRDSDLGSLPYPNRDQIRTYADFWRGRFELGMSPCDGRSDGICLLRAGSAGAIVYKENAAGLRVDLRGLLGPLRAVAVDTRRPYAEIDLGPISGDELRWTAPYASDWAISIEP